MAGQGLWSNNLRVAKRAYLVYHTIHLFNVSFSQNFRLGWDTNAFSELRYSKPWKTRLIECNHERFPDSLKAIVARKGRTMDNVLPNFKNDDMVALKLDQ